METYPERSTYVTRNKFVSVVAALAVAAAVSAAPALAKKGEHGGGHGKTHPATTKMKLKLASHEVATGEMVSGTVTLQTRDGNQWAALADAPLFVLVDGEQCGTATTDAEGSAAVTCAAADGDHVLKVRYDGDETHKKAQRAQGFTVGVSDDDGDDGEDDEPPVVDPTPAPTPTV